MTWTSYQGHVHGGSYRALCEDVGGRHDLRSLCATDGKPPTADYRWGDDSPGSLALAQSILWHVTRDGTVVDLLAETLRDDMVAGWGDRWVLSADEVRGYIDAKLGGGGESPGEAPWRYGP